jgi:hypothetical protein
MRETIQPVAEERDRVSRYRDVDGLPYLFTGLTIVLWGISFSIPSEILSLGRLGQILSGLGSFMPIWLTFTQGRLIEWTKTRLTYPRTGYVAPDPQARDWGFPEFLIFLPVFLVFGSMPFFASIDRYFFRWVLPVSLVFPVVGALMRRKALASEFVYVLGPILLGLICWLVFRPQKPFVFLFILIGTILAFVGFIRLFHYLWQNPRTQT